MGACSNLSPIEKCLAIIAHGADALEDGNFTLAEGAFRVGLAMAKAAPAEQGRDLVPLALLKMSQLRQKQAREDDARQLREQADAQLEQNPAGLPNAFFNLLMAAVLMELGEYRRAIPFWEQAIQLDDVKNPIDMAHMLGRVGECYNRIGLKDHAAIPLRAAVKIFRKHPEDPRLSAVLITLGNALRKSTPTEAESCYREVSDWHIARGQFLSATPAWGNIGILCSEQGRYAESLEYFEKVRKIREQSPGMPTSAIAITHNNIANCYRRMGKFAEAFTAVSRAIDLLQDKGRSELASAYGTRGLIFLDKGQDSEAVEWLRRAYEHHQTLASPNLDTVSEDLNREIAALRRLGRTDELKDAEARLASVHTAMNAVPKVSRDLSSLDGPMDCATAKGRKGTSWNRVRNIWELVDTEWAKHRIQSGLSSGEGLIAAAACGDVTTSDTGTPIADTRLFIVESELASVLKRMTREGNTLSATIRNAWDTGSFQVMVKRNPMKVDDAHISIVAHITLEELRRYLTATDSANGFANRFLWAQSVRSKCLPEGGSLSEQAKAALANLLKPAVVFGRKAGLIERDAEAKELWAKVYPELSEGHAGLFGAVTSRAEAQVLRLSMLYALLDCSVHIRRAHLEAALAVWQYCENTARWIFEARLGDSTADAILPVLLTRSEGMTRNEITNHFHRHKSSTELKQALARLQNEGSVRVERRKTAGRRTQIWIANDLEQRGRRAEDTEEQSGEVRPLDDDGS